MPASSPAHDTTSTVASPEPSPVGAWRGPLQEISLRQALNRIHETVFIVCQKDRVRAALGGTATLGNRLSVAGDSLPLLAIAHPAPISALGDRTFCQDLGIRYPYYAGAMAGGIGSVEVVRAMGEAGMLAFFGAAGLTLAAVESAVDRLQNDLGLASHGFNLIHSPSDPELETELAGLYVRRKVRVVEASAYMKLTLPVVRYRVHGVHRDEHGDVVTPNRVIAKVSRLEVAAQFFSPPPEGLLRQLVEGGDITEAQAVMAESIPVAQDVTAEADSGGHTDRRPAVALLPTMVALREAIQRRYGFKQKLRVGLGGGVATPASAAAAFAMGAAYVVTGSINQSCTEAGTSDLVRRMLAESSQGDITMAPAADMFELGVTVQVLKRGTMFPMRASRLYELYRAYDGIDGIPAVERKKLESQVFRAPLEQIWELTKAYFAERDPHHVARAEGDPKHKMALVFRWYLGQSSRWANAGVTERQIDYQIWCGPAMGAFNEWVRGTFMESTDNRHVVTVALNILHGAAVLTRAHQLRTQGVVLDSEAERIVPLEQADLEELLHGSR